MVANRIKGVLRQTFPKSFQRAEQALTNQRLRKIEDNIKRDYGLTVQAGPFSGMKYISEAVCSSLVPKLLGSYESELHAAFESLFKVDFKRVIDIGCAEGYYAVGVAMRLPQSEVYAFDIDTKARDLCSELAKINNVEKQVFIERECDHSRLAELTNVRSLIICDCEGCEMQLLQPDKVPGFRNCDFVVELHDMVMPNITPTIVERFSKTHDITLIDSTTPDPSRYPAIKNYPPPLQRTAVAEFRDGVMQWAWMRAK